jgi:hypothetical protein
MHAHTPLSVRAAAVAAVAAAQVHGGAWLRQAERRPRAAPHERRRAGARHRVLPPARADALPLTCASSLFCQAVLEELPDVVLAYGQSDEFSFVVRKLSTLYERRARCALAFAATP